MEIILALVSGLGGALVGGFLSGRLIAYAHSVRKQKLVREQDARTLLNLFQALEIELSALWTAYETLVGGELEGLDQPDELAFAGVISASQHYFGVYDHTAYLLGTLEPDSGKKIIDTYINLKLFFDELNTFQRLTSKHQEVRLKSNVNLYEAREVRQEHESFFAYLKKRHFQVKGLVLGTQEMLKEFISLGERARTAVTFKI
ncbi:MAG: hypothetical protein P8X65_08415 [Syntrophobacterales bacterium]